MRVDREMDTFPTPKKNPDGSIAVNEGRDFVEVEEEEPFVAPHFSSCCTHVSLGIFFLLLLLLSVINHEAIDAAFYYNDDVLETLESTTSYPETFPYLSEYPELQYSLMIDHNHKQITGSKKPVAHVPQMKDTQDGRSFMSADRLSEYRLFAVPKLSDGALEDNYASKLLRDNDRSFAERCKKSTAQRSTTTDGKLPRLKVSLDTDWNTVREMHFEPFDYSSGGRVEVDYSILPHVVPDWEQKQQKNKWFLFYPSEVSAIKEDLLLQFRDFSWNRFYLALNLYNNEDYIPYLTGALVSFFQDELEPLLKKLRDTDDTAGGSTLERSVIISIYLNEDKQETALLVKEFLLPHLKLLPLFADTPDNTNKIYLTTKGSCLKHNYKRKSLDRIEWLACVRNKALEPLYEDGMALFGVDEDKAAEESRTMAVLFLNDILFQPRDLITLLNSKTEAEIAKQEFFVYPRHDPTSPVVFDENENNLNFNPNVKNVEMTGFDMACGMDFYTFFYDTLVSRDIEGRLLLETYPYTMHKPTRRALRRILFQHNYEDAGRKTRKHWSNYFFHHPNTLEDPTNGPRLYDAVPVKCCWNGVAIIRGSFFVPLPVNRSKYHRPEEGSVVLDYREKHFGGRVDWDDTLVAEEGSSVEKTVSRILAHNPGLAEQPEWAKRIRDKVENRVSQNGVDWDSVRAVHESIQKHRQQPSGTLYLRKPSGALFKYVPLDTNTPEETYLCQNMHLYDHKIHLQRAKTLTIEWMFSFSLLDIYNNYKDKDHAHSLRYFIDMDDSVHDYFNKALVQAENAKFLSALPGVQCGGATPPLFAAKQHILRFRHVNAPSFRSLLSGGLFRKPDLYEFSTDSTKRENQFHRINYHSECLLFCSDLAEYSLFVENRIPRILMNPNVKFTYTPVFDERAHYLETHKREGLYYYYRAFMESEFLFDLMTLFYEVKSSLRFMEYMDKSMPAISGAGFNEVRQVFSPYHPHPESRRREGNFYYRYRVNTVSFIQMADGLMAEYFLDKEFWIYEVLLSRLIGIPLILVVFYYIWSDISYHIKLKLRETNPRRRKYLFYLPFGSTASQVYTINHDPAHPAGRDSPLWRDRFRTLLPQERLWYRVVIKGVEPFIFRVVLLHVKVRFYYNRWKKRLCKTLGRNGTDGRSV